MILNVSFMTLKILNFNFFFTFLGKGVIDLKGLELGFSEKRTSGTSISP